MMGMSKILIIGATGYMGKFIVEASVKAGHPTFILVRESTLFDRVKSPLIELFKNLGVTFITGDLYDHESLVKAIKQVNVVISTIGLIQLGDQVKIIDAIKEAGNVKKFYPSEFGNDVDRTHGVEPAKTAFLIKSQIRRAVENAGIPYTFVSSFCTAGHFVRTLSQLEPDGLIITPPTDKVVIFGDGNVKAVFNEESDIATYLIKTLDDPRTLNKVLYIKPAGNIYSLNELMSLWEKKINKTMEKTYFYEDEVLKNIQDAPDRMKMMLSIGHSVFVMGDQTNFEIDPSVGVEASTLYPNVKYTTVDEYLNRFV